MTDKRSSPWLHLVIRGYNPALKPLSMVTLLVIQCSAIAFSQGSFLVSADTCVDKEIQEQPKIQVMVLANSQPMPSKCLLECC